MSKVVAGIQARMGSTRLSGKSLMNLGDKPMIYWSIDRAQAASKIDEVWVLTSTNPEDDELADAVKGKANLLRGDSQDVRSRYERLLLETNASLIYRITGDCPFVDSALLDCLFDFRAQNDVEYSHILAQPYYKNSYPNGFNAELFTANAFQKMLSLGNTDFDREHVTVAVDSFPLEFAIARLAPPEELSRPQWKLSVDTATELKRMRLIVDALGLNAEYASVEEIVAVLDRHPEWQSDE